MKNHANPAGFGRAITPELIAQEVARNVRASLEEDLGRAEGERDWTAELLPAEQHARARVISREAAVICGQPWFDVCFRALDSDARIEWQIAEGEQVEAGATLCFIEAKTRALLTAERSALNFLQLLSAVATRTREHAQRIAHTAAKVCDTRKTVPGLRLAQKYAVAVGGGVNHRLGLYDGILIKENHIAAAGGVRAALHAAREIAPAGVGIEIEVETLEQLREALAAGARLILLDNFSLERLREAVAINRGTAAPAILEASGGISLGNIAAVAETGVDRISVGSLTKDLRAVDLSLRLIA